MIKYSDMLKEAINLFPKEIPCDDAHPIGDEGMKWYSLDDIYDELIEKTNNFEKDELLGALVWSVLVGITEGFREKFVQTNTPCTNALTSEVINLDITKEHFIGSIKLDDWQEHLREIGETVDFNQ